MKGGTVQINWHDVQPVLTLDFHPQTGFLATGGNDHDIKIWEIIEGESQKKLPTASYKTSLAYHSSAVNILRFSSSGEHLASGADGGELVLWKLHTTDDGDKIWKFLKTFIFHRKDVLDLEWSADGAFLVSGSVDNSCIIWNVSKGSVHQILDAHQHYVQGVSWDPLGQYIASLSSDRTCRVFTNKPQPKQKGFEKVNFACQHVLTKSQNQKLADSKNASSKSHLFHDETLPSFFRRLQWSPDGSFLLVPAGLQKFSAASETNTAYIISRKDLSRPAVVLPGASKPVVTVRFCPILFCLRGHKASVGFFKLPYRVVFAVATLDSLYVYDTESVVPIAIFAGLHYAAITDITWSPSAKYLALSSRDGYCTIIEFENNELGVPFEPSGSMKGSEKSREPTTDKKNEPEDSKVPVHSKNEPVGSMEIDNVEPPSTVDKSSESELKQAVPAATQKTDAPKKKRITPIAIL